MHRTRVERKCEKFRALHLDNGLHSKNNKACIPERTQARIEIEKSEIILPFAKGGKFRVSHYSFHHPSPVLFYGKNSRKILKLYLIKHSAEIPQNS